MGMMNKFGFGKKDKTPFKVPRGVQDLRGRIDTENRENFPSLARYKEIVNDAELVCQSLNGMIAKKDHAEEAARLRDEIRAKVDGLGDKIKRNMEEAQKDGKEDYVARNIDYLERKSYRNKAKTLFTIFLENFASFESYCRDGSMEPGKKIESVTAELFQAVADLHKGFFYKYGQDREIQAIKEDVLKKMSEIRVLYAGCRPRFKEKGLESIIESKLDLMQGDVRGPSP
jgi:glutamine synthetase type III